jgi:CcmD family protein
MPPPDLAALQGPIALLMQSAEPVTRFTAEAAAAQPAAVARGFRFLIAAYTTVWLVLAVYILSVSVRLRRLANQVRRLKESAS